MVEAVKYHITVTREAEIPTYNWLHFVYKESFKKINWINDSYAHLLLTAITTLLDHSTYLSMSTHHYPRELSPR